MKDSFDWIPVGVVVPVAEWADKTISKDDEFYDIIRSALEPGGFVSTYADAEGDESVVPFDLWAARHEAVKTITKTPGDFVDAQMNITWKLVAAICWAYCPEKLRKEIYSRYLPHFTEDIYPDCPPEAIDTKVWQRAIKYACKAGPSVAKDKDCIMTIYRRMAGRLKKQNPG